MATDTGHVRTQSFASRAESGSDAPREPIISTRDRQRARLLEAIVDVVAHSGYPDAKVADISRRAGVSRATFYQLFENKEAALLTAQAELADRVAAELEERIGSGEGGRAMQSAIIGIVDVAEREPFVFDFLMHETMLGGPAAQEERDRLIGRVQLAIEQAWQRAPGEAPLLDMSARFLLEGTIRLLGLRLRRDADAPRGLLDDLLAWVDSYTVSDGPPRWRTPEPEPALLAKQAEHAGTLSLHPTLPKGRHRLRSEVAKTVQRERITYATAEAIRAKGYAETTVADIVATAGLSRDVFYAQFHDKDEAFDATVQLVFEHLLATMAGAFFGDAGDWADQVWEAGWAFVRFLEAESSLAHFMFIATYAPPPRIGRVLDFITAFTLFVEGGNRCRPPSSQVSRTVTEAIVCTVLEAVNFHIRRDRVEELRGQIPAITYMVYAPYLGTGHAGSFVETRVGAERAAAAGLQP